MSILSGTSLNIWDKLNEWYDIFLTLHMQYDHMIYKLIRETNITVPIIYHVEQEKYVSNNIANFS